MPPVHDEAIALRRLDYSETSQVLAVFCRDHGQQRVIAKGIKRSTKTRVSVGIDLLEWGDVVYSRRPGKEDTLATLIEWRQRDNFPHLRRDLAVWYAGQYAAEVTTQLTEVHDPHPDLYAALLGLLRRLGRDELLEALGDFLCDLLREIGLGPDFGRCVACGRSIAGETVLHFSSRGGGAICRDCEGATIDKRRVTPQVAEVLAWSGGRPPRSNTAVDSAAHTEADTDAHTRADTDAGTKTGTAVGAARPTPDPRTSRAVFDLLDYHITELMSRPPRVSGPLREALDARG